jgi:dihydroorotase-like cyclic amidohydrolase
VVTPGHAEAADIGIAGGRIAQLGGPMAGTDELAAGGLPVYVEIRPLYLHLTSERFAEPDAGKYAGAPPLREASDREALWAGLAAGDVVLADGEITARPGTGEWLPRSTRSRP